MALRSRQAGYQWYRRLAQLVDVVVVGARRLGLRAAAEGVWCCFSVARQLRGGSSAGVEDTRDGRRGECSRMLPRWEVYWCVCVCVVVVEEAVEGGGGVASVASSTGLLLSA